MLEDATVDPDRTSRLLLRVLGIDPPDGPLDVWSVTDLVAFSSDHGGSIVDSISSARENARGAREVTSSESNRPMTYLPAAATLSNVASALSTLGLTPRELSSVLDALRAAGALEAEVVIQ